MAIGSRGVTDKVIYLRDPKKDADESRYKIKYAELLNPAQLEAVTHRDGPLLVIAGAGSGKTRTLIYRVARLIESGIPAPSILLLTFTRRASLEMLRRAESLVGDAAGIVSGQSLAARDQNRREMAVDFDLRWTSGRKDEVADAVRGAEHACEQDRGWDCARAANTIEGD